MSGVRNGPVRPALPPKDAPPGFVFRFDRWTTRKWGWREEATGRKCEGFASRDEALHDAYDQLRARRAGQTA